MKAPEPPARVRSLRIKAAFWLELMLAAAVSLAAAVCLLWRACIPNYVLSPSDVLLSTPAFGRSGYHEFEPVNRLLTDVALAFEPWLVEAHRQLSIGRFPFLNPYSGAGSPLFGNYQSALFCPFNWPYLLTGSPRAFLVAALLKLLVAGTGGYFLARRLALSPLAALIAAVWFELSGFVTVWLLYPLSSVAVWFPWLVLSLHALLRRPGPRQVATLGLVSSLVLLGGHPETAAHLMLGGFLFGAACVPWSMYRRKSWLRARLLATGGGLALGLAVAAPQIGSFLPYLVESLATTERGTHTHWRPAAEGVKQGVLSAVTLLVPYAYGSYARGDIHVERAFGLENFNEVCGGYVSVAGVLLFAAAWLSGRRRRWMRAALLLALCGWLVGYKMYPAYDLIQAMPFIGLMQNQRLLVWPALFVPLISAACIEDGVWLVLNRRARLFAAAPLMLTAIGSLAVAVVAPRMLPVVERHVDAHLRELVAQGAISANTAEARKATMLERFKSRMPAHYARAAAVCAMTAVLWLAGASLLDRRTFAVVLCLAGLGDLLLFAWPQVPVIPREHWYPPPPVSTERDARLPGGGVLVLGEGFPPNAPAVYRFRSLQSYDGIEHAGLASLLGAFDPRVRTPADSLYGDNLGRHTWRHRLLAIAGVRLLAAGSDGRFQPATSCWQRVGRIGNLECWELVCQPDCPAWFFPSGVGHRSGGWIAIATQALPLRNSEVIAGPARIDLTCRVPGPGVVVLPRLHLAGWRLAKGSDELRVLAVNSTLLGVAVPASGVVSVSLQYTPPLWTVSLTLSCLSLCLLLALSLWPVRAATYLEQPPQHHMQGSTTRHAAARQPR